MRYVVRILLPVLFLAASGIAVLGGPPLTKEELVKMTKAGLDEALILETVQDAESVPALATDDLIALKAEGVSQKVLQAVVVRRRQLERKEPAPVAPPDAPHADAIAATAPGDSDAEARIREMEAKFDAVPLGKALAILFGRAEDVTFEALLKAGEPEKALLAKAFAFAGSVEEFASGESSGRLINFNRVAWVDPVPAYVLVRKNGVLHVMSAAPIKKPADGIDPSRLNPTDNRIEDTSKNEVQFFLAVTKYDSAFKRDVSYKVRIKCSAKDLGTLLLSLGWKKK